ncbi:YcgL domain-containing protein [Ferrimonas balearica]|uniref:YcgL domain-containing protein n=1 Tax=Ferrimonas balearica TaxID=44012 RepID=UPI001C57FD91|nr:YcgL domain-containing protein [Ferrimonas balearica]MBW3138821.1 YcgL domain-containing protein [Ferrimonas balearica]MBW3163568.1 YcgL domain-containing protein [Ferrimonas balearica]MBY5979614.1 YcgL domain-containing protein [Ferrimonas balearica]MBY6105884.1 YcgL domain-containing protein [Ferrimonas balearica]MBY6223518.1 YcgL domain-containing protein [Ferrimonas balearica]
MICAIYKSSRKADTYLYVPKRDDFSQVPQPLMEVFGTPQFVMILPLAKIKQLANADMAKVTAELTDKGYYLQLPPPPEDLLKAHRRSLGLEDS